MKRLFDIVVSTVALLVLSPLMLMIALVLVFDDGFPVFFRQGRVGLNGRMFKVLKFRTMVRDAEKSGKLTVSGRDPRITRTGYILRKYKLDELPQLFNVLFGDMSLVGPRPEVPEYVALYSEEQREVLTVRPGITDTASLEFIDENVLLEAAENPSVHYTEVILPKKLALQLHYVRNRSFFGDVGIIIRTVVRIIR